MFTFNMDILSNTKNILTKKIENNSISAVESICLKHITHISKNKKHVRSINDVISDVLMNTVKENDGVIQVFLNTYQKNLVESLNQLFNEIRLNKFPFKPFTVYKGVSNIKNINTLYFPIPFSCCVDFVNSTLWSVSKDSFVIELRINEKVPFIFTGNLSEGNEVLLGKCKLELRNKYFKNNVLVCSYNIFV